MKERLLRYFASMIILVLALSGGEARALAQSQSAADAFQAAVDAYNQQQGVDYAVTGLREAGSLAYASAARPTMQNEADFLLLLAEERAGQGWQVIFPGDRPEAYNHLLDAFPVEVLDEATKAYLRQPEPTLESGADLLAANYTAHRLPWPFGIRGYVTQRDGSYHENQVDFDIQGLAASGDVYASKPGTVVFVKDSSNTTCQTPAPDPCWKKSNMVVVQHSSNEYSWYVHLAYRSATVSVGQQVGYGTKLGVEGETGYSFGVHLHYMASAGHTAWTDPNDPNAAPWATGLNPVDFDEYPWSGLIVTYSSTYLSQNRANLPACPAAGGVLLYREAGYGCGGLLENVGYTFRNDPGFQNLMASFNDQASSIRVPEGWSVLLYENTDRGGGKKCFNASDDTFANDTFDTGAQLNDRVSSVEVFSAPGCPARAPADNTPPAGSLSSPANGAVVGRSILLAAEASDDGSGVRQATFSAAWGGQERVIYIDTSAPYHYEWDACAAGVPNGSIALKIEVVDNAWNRLTGPTLNITKNYDCAAKPAGSWSADYFANTGLTGSPVLHADLSAPLLFLDWGSAAPGTGLPADGWSARFTRAFDFPGGDYRFHCQSAGGCRVLIDGQERIASWQEQAFTGQDWSGTLPAGRHEVRVEFFDASGEARLEAWWQGPGFLPPDSVCSPGQWCVETYGNSSLAGTPAARRDEGETLRRDWGSAGPDVLLPVDYFSSRAVRSANFDCGTYRFQVDTADAARLWVDDVLRIDQWSEPAQPARYTAELALERGPHSLRLEQLDTGGAASLHVGWEKLSSCPVSVEIEAASTHVARPGAVIEPVVRARVTGGYLDPARGDSLAFVSGSQMSAISPQPVRGLLGAGQSYSFDALTGLRMTAPSANGAYTSRWQLRVDGSAVGPEAVVQVTVDGAAPQARIISPGGNLTSAVIPLRAEITDSGSGVTHAQFLVGVDAGSGWAWRSLGWDLNGADGWGMDWNTSGIPDQSNVIVLVTAWDRAGNAAEARTGALTLDRTPPTAAITPLSAAQDSTRFLVQWTGSDNFSGLHHFDLQVIENGVSRGWINGVPAGERSAWFTGAMGSSYSFQVRAVDAAGNVSSFSSPSAAARINTCSADAFEPDGGSSSATERLIGPAAEAHTLCGTGDVDWFSFSAEAGKTYLIRADALGATTDTAMILYAADGTTALAESNSPYAPGASILWRAETSGRLYFSVRHADPAVAGNAVIYSALVAEGIVIYTPHVRR